MMEYGTEKIYIEIAVFLNFEHISVAAKGKISL